LDEAIFERASPNARVFASKKWHRRAGRQRGEAKAGHGRRAERDPHLIDFVLIRVVTRSVRPLLRDPLRKDLDGQRSPLLPIESEGPIACALPRPAAL
jgi:hypothetical protein